jgi:hypothetical protein
LRLSGTRRITDPASGARSDKEILLNLTGKNLGGFAIPMDNAPLGVKNSSIDEPNLNVDEPMLKRCNLAMCVCCFSRLFLSVPLQQTTKAAKGSRDKEEWMNSSQVAYRN